MTYAHSKGADMVVAGSRGIGSMTGSMMRLVGLGSVSDYLAHNLECAALLVKIPRTAAASPAEKNKKSVGTKSTEYTTTKRSGGRGGTDCKAETSEEETKTGTVGPFA